MLTTSPICYLFLYIKDLLATRELFEALLGFEPVELDAAAVKYRSGRTIIALNRAGDFGIDLDAERTQALIVLHVSNVAAADAALADLGVTRGVIDRYDIGATVEILNEERHGLMLYEPSAEALTWPSARKIRAVMRGEDPTPLSDEAAAGSVQPVGTRPVVYVFLFVRDAEEARAFYSDKLGLKVIETDESVGVVKYDAGAFILATHAEDHLGAVGDPPRASAMSCAFLVEDIAVMHADLSARGVVFATTPVAIEAGKIARFHDPNGHAFYLYELTEAARSWPSGRVIDQLVSDVKAEH